MLAGKALASETVPAAALRLGPTRWRLLAGLVATATSVVALALLVDLSALGTALRLAPEQPLPLVAAAVAYTAAFWLRAVAWQRLLGGVSTGRLFSVLQTSLFLNHLLPFKAGEVVRPLLLMHGGSGWAEAASSTLVARLCDFAALALIAGLVLPLNGGSATYLPAVAAGVALVATAAAGLVLLRAGAIPLLPARLQSKLGEMQAALRRIGPRTIAAVSPLVVLSWLLEASVLLAAAEVAGVELSLGLAVGATAFTILFQLVQFTPGGIGVYESSMTGVLVLGGVPAESALLLAIVTHGLKFAYSFSVGAVFAAAELVGVVRGRDGEVKSASRFEVITARAWNVVNEGKPFTPVFTLGVVMLLTLVRITDVDYLLNLPVALLAMLPLAVVFWRFDFPLHLRTALWVYLGAWLAGFRFIDPLAAGLVIGIYLIFTVVVWGTVYYHLRIGTAWTNGLRFWRLVLENPDPTSGNLQEQLPKCLLLVLGVSMLASEPSLTAIAGVEAFTIGIGLGALLLHQWLFTWVPPLRQPGLRPKAAIWNLQDESSSYGVAAGFHPQMTEPAGAVSKRVIAIVIDGCRADRLCEASTPHIDRLRAAGTDYTHLSTVYPARTVTCFASMLTGAAPATHGMRSNFVPSLGVKCDSVFEALRRAGKRGRLVGIAHLIDAFGDNVRSVTAVMHNDEIDDALIARAKEVLTDEDPELLVLQLLSVDQTGHAHGSYREEYLRKIEVTDAKIGDFLTWCETRGYLEDATLLLTADHGQGIGIGGHGHMSPPEIIVPCILSGTGVPAGVVREEARSIVDIADTVCGLLGVAPPHESVGVPLLPLRDLEAPRPLAFVVPAYNEATALPGVLTGIKTAHPDATVIVVDDGSTDATAAVATGFGAIVVRHDRNRGLGAALRTGLAAGRDIDPRAVVYLDADSEYDPADAARLLAPIERGEADYVLGSRFMDRPQGMTAARRFANRCFSLLLSLCCGRWISDGQTGMRAFSPRALAVAEVVHDYNYAQALTLDLLRKGMRLAQVPVAYRRRSGGRSFVTTRYLWKVPLGMAREMLSD